MTLGVVQNPAGGFGLSPASLTIAPTTAGNPLVVLASTYIGSPGTVTGVTDNMGNTYTQAPSARSTNSANNVANDIWYCSNPVGGVTSVSVAFTGGILGYLFVYELSGFGSNAPTFVTGIVNNGASTSAAVTAPITTTIANAIIITVVDHDPSVASVNSPYTADASTLHSAYNIVTNTVAGQTATFNFSAPDTYCASSIAVQLSAPPAAAADCLGFGMTF